MPGILKSQAKREKSRRRKTRIAKGKGQIRVTGKVETTLATGDTRSRTAEFERMSQMRRT
jgi:hypothetical protein